MVLVECGRPGDGSYFFAGTHNRDGGLCVKLVTEVPRHACSSSMWTQKSALFTWMRVIGCEKRLSNQDSSVRAGSHRRLKKSTCGVAEQLEFGLLLGYLKMGAFHRDGIVGAN